MELHSPTDNVVPADKVIVNKNVIEHGSATLEILRVEWINVLVIAKLRRRAGEAYYKYLAKFLMAIEEGLK